MSTLREALDADVSATHTRVLPGQLPVLPQMVDDSRPKANSFLRCPLPPFNSDPDTLRQFETGNQMPQIRVMPLPTQATATSTSGSASSSASSGSSSVVPVQTSLKPVSVPISTGVLVPGANYQTTLLTAKSFQLLSITATNQCEVRIYGSAIAQSFDVSRPLDSPVAAEISANIITCPAMDELPFQWQWQNRIGANQDTPQSTNMYITVFNTHPSDAASISLALTYLPLES